MKRHFLRARRLSLCATAAGLCISGSSITLTPANAAPETVHASPEYSRANTFLGNIVSGNAAAGWASRSSWETVFRAGVPSFFGAEFVSFTSQSNSISPMVEISQSGVANQPALRGFGEFTISAGTLQLTSPSVGQGAAGGVVKLGSGTLQIGSSGGSSVTLPVSNVNSGNLTVSQGASAPVSGGVINVTSGGTSQSDVQIDSAGTADVVTAPPPPVPPRPVIRPRPPTPPRPPVVSR